MGVPERAVRAAQFRAERDDGRRLRPVPTGQALGMPGCASETPAVSAMSAAIRARVAAPAAPASGRSSVRLGRASRYLATQRRVDHVAGHHAIRRVLAAGHAHDAARFGGDPVLA